VLGQDDRQNAVVARIIARPITDRGRGRISLLVRAGPYVYYLRRFRSWCPDELRGEYLKKNPSRG
jgi:hypothetical protein